MKTGPGTVIFGAIFASFVLTVILLNVTTGSAGAKSPIDDSEESSQESGDVLQEIQNDQNNPGQAAQDCEISNHYPGKIIQWCEIITHYANKRGLDPDLIAALIWQESGGNPVAYSKSGAVGLMQVMPKDGISASFMCVNGPCFSNRPTIAELQDPEFNVSYGTKMLARLFNKNGNLRDALKSYGPMNVGYYYADKVLGIYQNYGQ